MVAIAIALVGGSAGTARADTATCSFDSGTRTVKIDVTPGRPESVSIRHDRDGFIFARGEGEEDFCDGATVFSTDEIAFRNATPATPLNGGIVLHQDYTFAPGFTDEPGSSDEIEFVMALGAGGRLQINPKRLVYPDWAPLVVAAGDNSINLNPLETEGLDADIVVHGLRLLFAGVANRDDLVLAGGGFGTPPSPALFPVRTFSGDNDGNDTQVGGDRKDALYGDLGDDRLAGNAERDLLDGGEGRDLIRGGPGDDVLIAGGPGSDRDRLYGGAGFDRCMGRGDLFDSCERITR